MKQLTLILIFTFLITKTSYSQCCPYMGGIELIPKNPTINDSIKLVTYITTPGRGRHLDSLLNNRIQFDNNNINLFSCHFSGQLAEPQYFSDTFEIGKLEMGNYTVIHHAFQSAFIDSCVMNYQNFDTLNLTVSKNVSTREVGKSIKIFPNFVNENQNVLISSDKIMTELILFNQFGLISLREKIMSDSYYIPTDKLAPGLYFVQIKISQNWIAKKFIKL